MKIVIRTDYSNDIIKTIDSLENLVTYMRKNEGGSFGPKRAIEELIGTGLPAGAKKSCDPSGEYWAELIE